MEFLSLEKVSWEYHRARRGDDYEYVTSHEYVFARNMGRKASSYSWKILSAEIESLL